MYCSNCGKEVKDNWDFCNYCGTKIVKINGNNNIDEKESKTAKSNTKTKRHTLGKIILSIFFIYVGFYLFVGVLVGIFMASDQTENTTSKGYVEGVVWTEDGTHVIKSNDFEIIKEETTLTREEDGNVVIKGKVKQNIEGAYTGLFITLEMVDKNGKKVRDTSGFSSSEYEGNNIWSFTVYGNDKDNLVEGYKIDTCYGY